MYTDKYLADFEHSRSQEAIISTVINISNSPYLRTHSKSIHIMSTHLNTAIFIQLSLAALRWVALLRRESHRMFQVFPETCSQIRVLLN